MDEKNSEDCQIGRDRTACSPVVLLHIQISTLLSEIHVSTSVMFNRHANKRVQFSLESSFLASKLRLTMYLAKVSTQQRDNNRYTFSVARFSLNGPGYTLARSNSDDHASRF